MEGAHACREVEVAALGAHEHLVHHNDADPGEHVEAPHPNRWQDAVGLHHLV